MVVNTHSQPLQELSVQRMRSQFETHAFQCSFRCLRLVVAFFQKYGLLLALRFVFVIWYSRVRVFQSSHSVSSHLDGLEVEQRPDNGPHVWPPLFLGTDPWNCVIYDRDSPPLLIKLEVRLLRWETVSKQQLPKLPSQFGSFLELKKKRFFRVPPRDL